MHRLLFVCTGNICRSPTAEGVMRHLVRAAGKDAHYHLDSAGTHGYHVGEAPDPRSCQTALGYGVDIASLRARRAEAEDFEMFDLLLALDQGHLRHLRALAPAGLREKAQLFLPYAGVTGALDVPDPYYGSAQDFEHTYRLIEEGCRLLLQRLSN